MNGVVALWSKLAVVTFRFVCSRLGGSLLERVGTGSGAWVLFYLIDLITSAGFFPAMISSSTPTSSFGCTCPLRV